MKAIYKTHFSNKDFRRSFLFSFVLLIGKAFQELNELLDRPEPLAVIAAQGAGKPSSATVHKLAKDLAAALAGRTLTPAQRSRVAQDLQAVVSGANVPAAQMDDIIGDVPVILKRAGADAAAAAARSAPSIRPT